MSVETTHKPILHQKQGKGASTYPALRAYQDPLSGRVSGQAEGVPLFFAKTKERLTPTPTNPTVCVRDANAWTVEIEGFHDESSNLSHTKSQLKGDYPSLDNVTKRLLSQRGPPKIYPKKPENQKHQISHSITSQYDLIARPRLEGQLAKKMRLPPSALATQHILLKNGLTGVSYQALDGTIVKPKYAIAGSHDRESPRLQMARRIAPLVKDKADPGAPSYCYTGRPDSFDKALEHGKMVFLGEVNSTYPKGISFDKDDDGDAIEDEDGDLVYTLDYVVTSLQSNSVFYSLKGENERTYFKNEQEALKQLRNDVHTIIDPLTKKQYKVRFRPILFSRQVNLFGNLEKGLDSSLTGSALAIEASRLGLNELKRHMSTYLPNLSPEEQALAIALMDKLETSMNCRILGGRQMEAVEELTCRAMFCILLDLPITYHCKSSTDRTSLAVALHVSLCQWVKQGLPLPQGDNFEKIIDNEYFKELFALNWVQGHQITRNSRAPEGMIEENGFLRELDHEVLGICCNESIAQCNLIPRLLPKRYLKDYGRWCLVKEYFVKHPILSIVYLLFSPLVGALNALSTLLPGSTLWKPTGSSSWLSWSAWLLLLPFRLGYMIPYNFVTGMAAPFFAAPTKVVDLDALGVGQRRLLKEATQDQNAYNTPIEAIPANAGKLSPKELAAHMGHINKAWKNSKLTKKSPGQIYDLFFQKRFGQDKRPIRHFIKGDVVEHRTREFESDAASFFASIKVKHKKWEIDGKEFYSLENIYEYLISQRKFSEERAIAIMKKQIPSVKKALTKKKDPIHMRKALVFKKMKPSAHKKWQIDGRSYNRPQALYDYLTRNKKLSEENALDIMCCMQKGASHYADSYLKTTLASSHEEINTDIRQTKKISFNLDTSKWILRIMHDNEVYTTDDSNAETIHATIRTVTVLNCNNKNTEYGQGHIECRLVGEYIPVNAGNPLA